MAKDLHVQPLSLIDIADACRQRGLSKRERDTSYFGVVAVDGSSFRTIVCASGLQYILQRRYECIRTEESRAVGYLTSRGSLIMFYERSERLTEATKPVLLGLPQKPEQAWRLLVDALVSGKELPFPATTTGNQ
jgi:hypothetical protein